MITRDYIRHRLIGTPIDAPARALREVLTRIKLRKCPEIRDALLEDRFLHEIIHNHVHDGTNCVDVGAHLGAVTHLFQQHSPTGKHVCVEPTPQKAAWLRKRYPKVQVVEGALSDRNGTVSFFHQPKNSGFSGLGKQDTDVNDLTGVTEIKVPCFTLDSVVKPDQKIGFLKIDVEGAELLVLRGATRILANDKPIVIFECTKSGTASLGVDPRDLYTLLAKEYGMQVFTPRGYLEKQSPLTADELITAMNYPFKAFSFVASTQNPMM